MSKRTDDFASQSVEETLLELKTSRERGLDSAEVEKRIARFGYNEIQEHEESLWHRIMRRFWGPIPWMIELPPRFLRLCRNGMILSSSSSCCW